jgi:hypothetical protein
MILPLVALAVVSAAEFKPITVAAPGLSVLDLSPAENRFFDTHLAQALVASGLSVITPEQITAVIGIERQKELLGCAEGNAACLAEIANALNADALLTGSLAKLDDEYRYSLTMVSAANALPLATASGKARSRGALADALTVSARQLAESVARRLDRPLIAGAAAPSRGFRWGWVPLGAGVVAAGASGYFLSQASAKSTELRNRETTLTHAQATEHVRTGTQQRNLGFGLAGGGVVAIGAGAAMLLLGGQGQGGPTVAVSAGPGAAGFAVSGVWR